MKQKKIRLHKGMAKFEVVDEEGKKGEVVVEGHDVVEFELPITAKVVEKRCEKLEEEE